MAVSINSNEDLRGMSTLVGFLTHPEWYHWILGAMDDHERNSDLIELIFRIELLANKQRESWEKPEGPPRNGRSGREWRLQHNPSYLFLRSQTRCHGRSKRLTERNNLYGSNCLSVDEELVTCLSIEVQTGLAWVAFALAISTVFNSEHVRRRIAQKFVDVGPIGDVSSVSMKCQERKLRSLTWNPPSMQFHTVGRVQPHVLNGETSRIPVSCESIGHIGEKDQVRFEHSYQEQSQTIPDNNGDPEPQESPPKASTSHCSSALRVSRLSQHPSCWSGTLRAPSIGVAAWTRDPRSIPTTA
jgi:hypothetical protein